MNQNKYPANIYKYYLITQCDNILVYLKISDSIFKIQMMLERG